jgi:7-cyano-7-deazaguanine synthase in queuosine biosynthesis
LCNRIHDGVADRFLLFGAGGNPAIRGVQQHIFEAIAKRLNVDLNLMQLHIYQRDTKNTGLRPDKRSRARGLVFMLLGCAYARLEGQNALALYENGYGAINLPFRASEVGLDHARSVHPLSQHMVSHLVSLVFNTPFLIHNPFLWWTKAEMCRVIEDMNVVDIAWETISCDRPHRKDTPQCGRCSSCLLRRESFLASGTPDRTPYLIHKETGEARHNLLRGSHLAHMHYQAHTLQAIVEQNNAWEILRRLHPTRLADLVDRLSAETSANREELISALLSLYERYANEWQLGNVQAVFDRELEDLTKLPKRKKHATAVSHEGI